MIAPFYRGGNGNSETLSNLPKARAFLIPSPVTGSGLGTGDLCPDAFPLPVLLVMCFLLALSHSRGEESAQQPVDHCCGAGAHRRGHGHHHHHHGCALPEKQERLQARRRDEPASASKGSGSGEGRSGGQAFPLLAFEAVALTVRNILTSPHFEGDP